MPYGTSPYHHHTIQRLGKNERKSVDTPASFILRNRSDRNTESLIQPRDKNTAFNKMYGVSLEDKSSGLQPNRLYKTKEKARGFLLGSLERVLLQNNAYPQHVKLFNIREKKMLGFYLKRLEDSKSIITNMKPKEGTCFFDFQEETKKEILSNIDLIKVQMEEIFMLMLIRTEDCLKNNTISQDLFHNFQQTSSIYKEAINMLVMNLLRAEVLLQSNEKRALRECCQKICNIRVKLANIHPMFPGSRGLN